MDQKKKNEEREGKFLKVILISAAASILVGEFGRGYAAAQF